MSLTSQAPANTWIDIGNEPGVERYARGQTIASRCFYKPITLHLAGIGCNGLIKQTIRSHDERYAKVFFSHQQAWELASKTASEYGHAGFGKPSGLLL